MAATEAATAGRPPADRLPRAAERTLRALGGGRIGLGLILAVGAANLLAAIVPGGAALLEGWPYALLLGATALASVAAAAVRWPAAWREWRRPGRVVPGAGARTMTVPARRPTDVARILTSAGYRVVEEGRRGTWAVHGIRHGASRLAAPVSHLAVGLVVLGVAIGAAFGSEATFSLLAGDQALLDAPRPGFSSAIRLETLDAAFDAQGRPARLDTEVTFLRGGDAVERTVLRVNDPGSFDGYLVHPWTYGPAVHLRIATLAGQPLLAAPVPLDEERDGVPAGSVDLPTVGATLGIALADADANEIGISLVDGGGLVDTARLATGDEVRVGDVSVSLHRFDAWVTFLSRRDPGVGVLFAGAALLCLALAAAAWLPARRVTVRPAGADVRLVLRGGRFDRPEAELARLTELLGGRA